MSETTETKQPPPTPGTSDPTVLEEAQTLLVQGKRFMALGDYQSATDSLEQAVQLYDAYYGVAKIQCADAYLEYGNALVALANLEAGSGTDKIMRKAGIDEDDEGEDEDEDGDEEEEDEEEGGEEGDEAEEDARPVENGNSTKENGSGGTSSAATNGQPQTAEQVPMESSPVKADATENGVAGDSIKDQLPPQASSSSAPEPMPGTSSGSGGGDQAEGEDDENDEATTIEIAWEVLCLAKRLYMTDESLEGRLKLAETLQKLGEISIEWDNNDNAVSILEECLNIRKAILPAEDRLIALTYYHLGLAHSFKSDTQNANDNFQNAIDVIEKRIKTLTGDLEKAKGHQDTQAVSVYEKEINELKELLPDMTMRMDDSKEDGSQSSEVLKRTREEIQLEDEEAKKVCLDKSKPVADISHLVKRKVEPKE